MRAAKIREVKRILADIEGMQASCAAANRHPSESEIKIVDGLLDRVEIIDKEITYMDKQLAAQPAKEYARRIKNGEQLSFAEREIARQIAEIIGDENMDPIFSQPISEPIKPDPQGGMSGGYSYRNGVYRPTSSGPFPSLGAQCIAIALASIPGGEVDHRLPQFRAVAGGNEGIPSEGGFLVQTDFSSDLLTGTYQKAPAAQLCRRLTISGNSNGIKLPAIDETSRASGSRLGGVQMYWVGEGDTVTAKKPKFRQIELNLNKILGLSYVTDELLSDSAMLGSILRDGFTGEAGFMLDDCILNGSGAGMPLGILNSPALVTVDKEANQVAATVVYENLVNMWSRMPARNRTNAVWIINQDIEPQLYTLGLAVGTGGSPVSMPSGGISSTPYSTLFGRPIIPVEQDATLGTVGDIILADLSQYLLVDKGGVNFQRSIHVRFIYDEMTFRLTYRVDGQPIPNAAVTPFKGSNQVSPFVALQSRA
jgi:HK97 family phage major capsid protein